MKKVECVCILRRLHVVATVLGLSCLLLGAKEATAQGLEVALTTTSDVASTGETIVLTRTVSNSGSITLTGVSADLTLPDYISSDAGEVVPWDIGDLQPGASKTSPISVTFTGAGPLETAASFSVTADGGAEEVDSVDFSIPNDSVLQVNLAPDTGPARPGEEFGYTITYGNAGDLSPTATTLSFSVPENTTVSSISDAGVESGGVVTWSLGVFQHSQGGQVRVELSVDPLLEDGKLLLAEAALDPAEGANAIVRSTSATPIRTTVPLEIHYTVSQTTVRPGDGVNFTLVATNPSASTNITNGVASILLPRGFDYFVDVWTDVNCSSDNRCYGLEQVTWTVGDLGAGETRRFDFRATMGSAQPGGTVAFSQVIVRTGNGDEFSAFQDLLVDESPVLDVSLAPDPGPAQPGGAFGYTLTYGNSGDLTSTNAVLTLVVPEHTSVESISDGGTQDGDIVTWNIGVLQPGQGARVRAELRLDDVVANGELLLAEAIIDSDIAGEFVMHATTATAVRESIPLQIQYSVTQVAVESGVGIDMVVTATNATASDYLTDGVATIVLPDGYNYFVDVWDDVSCGSDKRCYGSERVYWTIGDLAPGETRTFDFRAYRGSALPGGTVSSSHLIATTGNGEEFTAAKDLSVDTSPLLHVVVAPDPGPAQPDEAFGYTISYGNTGDLTPTNTVLTFAVPKNTVVESVTHGGTHEGGMVTWNLGVLRPGLAAEVRVETKVAASVPDGALLLSEATIDPNISGEYVVRSSTATPVREDVPLELHYSVSEEVVQPGEGINVTLTATNPSATEFLTSAVATIVLPSRFNYFVDVWDDVNCSSDNRCYGSERVYWTIGDLAPGETRTFDFRAYLSATQAGGHISATHMTVKTGAGEEFTAYQNILIDESRLLSIHLAPDPGPARPGHRFGYTLTYGNAGDSTPTNSVLSFAIPEHTEVEEIGGGGTQSDGLVTWDLGAVAPGNGGQVRVELLVDASVADGELLRSEATFDSNEENEFISRSSIATPVRNEVPLQLHYAFSQTTIDPGRRLDCTITATNSSSTKFLTDAFGSIILPDEFNYFTDTRDDLSCGSDNRCYGSERVYWTIGNLAPGETRTLDFRAYLPATAEGGQILSSYITVSTGSGERYTAYQDLLVDESPVLRVNLAPDPGPAHSGEGFGYTASYGNASDTTPTNAVLTLAVPENVTVESISDGGIQAGDWITWNLGVLPPGQGGQVRVETEVDASAGDGELLRSEVAIDSNEDGEFIVRSFAATAVQDDAALAVHIQPSVLEVNPDDIVTYILTAKNESATQHLSSVTGSVLLPDWIDYFLDGWDAVNCGSDNRCYGGEWIAWDAGDLDPGEEITLEFTAVVASGAELGNELLLAIHASSGAHYANAESSVLIGDFTTVADGACCFANEQCEVRSAADCLTDDGMYQGNDTVCDPNPCDQPTGACCATDGSCTVTTQADCAAEYKGDGTVCDPNPCDQPTGACCATGGSCTVTTQADCAAEYEGDGTVCDPNPCDQPTGACCATDGSCTVTTQADCAAEYKGDGTVCDPNPCDQPTGACCATDGSCTVTTQADCAAEYKGDGTVCDPNPCDQPTGACCAADGSCTVTTQADCAAEYRGDGTVCDPNPCPQATGACCTSGTACELLTSETCVTLGSNAEYHGDGTTCSPEPCTPRIIGVLPETGATASPVAPIVVLFDEEIQGVATWTVTTDGQPVPGVATVSSTRAVFTPDDPYALCDPITAELTGGITDANGNAAEARSWNFQIGCNAEDVQLSQAPVHGRFMLMALPTYTSGRLSDVFTTLGDLGESTWRVFGWNNGSYSENPTIQPGQAFWIAGTADVFDGSPLSVNDVPHGDGFRVALDAGWNMIGVPMRGDATPWTDVLVLTATGAETIGSTSIVDTPVHYVDGTSDFINNGSYAAATALNSNPYGGYWIRTTEACELVFGELVSPMPGRGGPLASSFGDAPASNATTHAAATGPDEWTMELRIDSGSQGEGGILIGTRSMAEVGRDRLDVPKPPLFQTELSLVTRVDGETDPYLVSYLSTFASDLEWTIQATGEAEFANLSWLEQDPVPAGMRLYLFDENDRVLTELKTGASFRIVLSGTRELTVRATVDEIEVPSNSLALRIGPNPVRTSTQISLDLRSAARVSLRMIDVTGRTIAEIHEGALDAGQHNFNWTPAGAGSGVFFLRGFVDAEAIHHKVLVIQ